MARLSPLDAAFLAVESPTAHMHVGWAAVFDPPADGPPPRFEELRAHIAARLPRAPRYRQLIRKVPFALATPIWVDDPDFDVSRHVLPARSGRIGTVVDESMSRPLPHDRPLWQILVADRLDDGRIGVVGKAHHCMVDGIAAVELGSLLLDPTPSADEPAPGDWRPAPAPGPLGLVASAIGEVAREQLSLARLPARLARSPRRALELPERVSRAGAALVDMARPAPSRTPFNPPISPMRHLALVQRPLEDLRRIKSAFGVTLNDAFLAACTRAVRRFLAERGDDPIRLKAMVPISVRGEEGSGELGNRLSFMFVDLPCDEPDPVRELREIRVATEERKRSGQAEGGSDVVAGLGLAPSPVWKLFSRLIASPRAFNLVVSNIPGPRERLYMLGCPLAEAYPVVPIADRHALSIGVATVSDTACFGLYADPESLPDVDDLGTDLDLAIDELVELSADPSAGAARITEDVPAAAG